MPLNVNSKVVFVGAVWIGLGSLVNRTLGMETLQLYVIVSLIVLFIRYGTGNNKRRPGEASPYEFLNPKAEDLADEVVPFVAVERLKRVLRDVQIIEANIPNENTKEGAQLRKMISKQGDTKRAIEIVETMSSLKELPDLASDSCPCGSLRKFGTCCPELTAFLMKNRKTELSK